MNVKNVNSGIVVLIVDQILTEKTKKANHSIAPINQKKVFGKRISRILSVNWEVKQKLKSYNKKNMEKENNL